MIVLAIEYSSGNRAHSNRTVHILIEAETTLTDVKLAISQKFQ